MFRLWTEIEPHSWRPSRLLTDEDAHVLLDKADVVKPYDFNNYFQVWVEDEMFMLVKEQ